MQQPYDGFIRADKQLLSRVIDNLISNAIKYSPEHSVITVSMKKEEHDFALEIVNEGSGIPDEAKPYLFDSFFRVDALATAAFPAAGWPRYCQGDHAYACGQHRHCSSQQAGAAFIIRIPLERIAEESLLELI